MISFRVKLNCGWMDIPGVCAMVAQLLIMRKTLVLASSDREEEELKG